MLPHFLESSCDTGLVLKESLTLTASTHHLPGNLNSRRTHIENIESRADSFIIHSLIPLAETFGFASDLRSLSQGRASHTMQFHSYKELPADLTEHIKARGFLPRRGA